MRIYQYQSKKGEIFVAPLESCFSRLHALESCFLERRPKVSKPRVPDLQLLCCVKRTPPDRVKRIMDSVKQKLENLTN